MLLWLPFAQEPGGGLIVLPNAFTVVNRARDRGTGGAASPTGYLSECCIRRKLVDWPLTASSLPDLFRRAASYVDRDPQG